jgi:hypothetical protein
VSRASVVEAALTAFLTPESSDRLETAFGRRLDRLSRQLVKLDYHVEVGNEAFALYLLRWLAHTPMLPEHQSAPARASAERRYADFVDVLARRMEGGRPLSDRIVQEAERLSREEPGP